MEKNELIKKLEDIEWEDFEVKEAKSQIPQNAWETVSAFANTNGGWLIFGCAKSRKQYSIQGVDNPEKVENDFLTILRGQKFNKKIAVQSRRYSIDRKTVLGFYIQSASAKDKPIYFNSPANTFIRTGSGDQRATKEEIDAMYRNSSFDKKDEELTSFTVGDLDQETIVQYRTYLENIDVSHRYNKLSKELFLEKLRVFVKGKVTVGGLLVFGKEDVINDVVSDFRIDYLEVMGKSYTDALSRYSYRLPQEKNLFSYYFSIFERLIKKIDIPFKLKGSFGDENQPQVIAIREALVNLLMHTDYFSSAKPRIRVFSDRIEFFNPGSLPKDIAFILKEDFSLPRNPVIAKIFRIIRLSENIGSGFDKMINGWHYYYAQKPLIEEDFDYYKITFRLERKDEGISEGINSLLIYIRNNPGKRANYISDGMNIPAKTIERWLKALKDDRRIEFRGSNRTGGYFELEKTSQAKSGLSKQKNEGVKKGINEGTSEGVNEGINSLLVYMRNNPGKRTNHISERMGIPAKTIEKWLKALKDDGKIEFRGSNRTGGYFEVK